MQFVFLLQFAILAITTFLIYGGHKHADDMKSWLIVVLTVVSAILSLIYASSLLLLLGSLSYAWVLLSNLRLLGKRRSPELTHRVVREGWLVFMLLYFVFLALDFIIVDSAFVSLFSVVSLGVAVLVLVLTVYHAITYRVADKQDFVATELPAVTLAVPARNETHAIRSTLEQAVASDYSKLEILVIDDCSQDRTPQIIRDFAHEGVRFIQGAQPSEEWLGKNASYKALSDDSSGDYIVFSGVDVSLSPGSISKLVAFTLENELDMVSVMPQRVSFDFLANFLQTTRYFFQFILPWELLPVNPVLSSLWIIKRETLLDMGNFDVTSSLVVPERFFANELGKQGRYRFVVSDSSLGIASRKRTSSQMETATRTLYPLLRSNPMLIFLATIGLLTLLVLPFVVTLMSIAGGSIENYYWAPLTSGLLVLTNLVVYTRFNASTWFIGLVNFPFIVILEAMLLQWSMVKYEYSKVVWKDRNICIPVLNPPLKRQRDNQL